MTPREAFNFAQMIRTDKLPELVDVRTDTLLKNLGLEECADVRLD